MRKKVEEYFVKISLIIFIITASISFLSIYSDVTWHTHLFSKLKILGIPAGISFTIMMAYVFKIIFSKWKR